MLENKLAAPLFILRQECAEDLMGVLERLAALGFDGVEFLGLFGHEPEAIRKKLDELGLKAIGNHASFEDFEADYQKQIEIHKILGCEFISVVPVREGLPGQCRHEEVVEKLTLWGRAARKEGMRMLFHNHASELRETYEGKYVYEAMMDALPADAYGLEPDLGWIAIGGADPVYFLRKYKDRCPALHFKDFFASDVNRLVGADRLAGKRGGEQVGNFEFRPTGYGIMNYPAILADALACQPDWIIIDHDLAYERDKYEDLRISLEYTRELLKRFS